MLSVLEGEEVRRRWAGRLLAQADAAARVREIVAAVRMKAKPP